MNTNWLPIEDAPDDGTPVLACNLEYYAKHDHLPVVVRYRTYHPNAKGDKTWRDVAGHKQEHVTHYIPLPPP